MNKVILLSIFSFCLITGTSAQTVEAKQKTLITKKTATWCGFCGSWGWDLFEHLLEDNSEKALLISAHYSGKLMNSTAEAYMANISTAAGQPRFFVNESDISASSSNSGARRTATKTTVDANAEQTPLANAGILSSKDGNTLTIKTKTKFFDNDDGEFYLAIYLLEDDVQETQASRNGIVDHPRVLRTAADGGTFGQLIVNGAVSNGMEFSHDFTVEIANGWVAENIEIAAVIYQKVNGKYAFVNAFTTKELDSPVTTSTQEQLASQWGVSVYPNITSTFTNINLELNEGLKQSTIELLDINGRSIQQIHQGSLDTGKHSFVLNKSAKTPAGIYLLSIQSNGQRFTQKIIFR